MTSIIALLSLNPGLRFRAPGDHSGQSLEAEIDEAASDEEEGGDGRDGWRARLDSADAGRKEVDEDDEVESDDGEDTEEFLEGGSPGDAPVGNVEEPAVETQTGRRGPRPLADIPEHHALDSLDRLHTDGLVFPRSDSPDAMSVSERPRTPNSPRDLVSPINKRAGGFERTITINEPTRDSDEKDDRDRLSTLTGPSRPRRRGSRRLSLFRTETTRSLSSFSSMMSESWSERHNPEHRGLWWAVWQWIKGKDDLTEKEKEKDPNYIPPKYRWTPILSGLLQPFSILLEIPGLTEHWYIKIVQGGQPTYYQQNPIILDVGLAISMFSAVVANIALISRFMERRVYASTLTTIIGLSIHDAINIAAVTVFGVVHRFNDGFTYSEAFWMCVCSTVASMVTNATLIYDLLKTKDFRRSGSGLTPKQRSLVIIVMILLVYLALGALCFNFLLPEISFQSALYFTVVTIETVGFGDVLPTTLGAKIFLFFYAPIGILNLAVTVGTARDTLVESWSTAYRRRRHEVAKRQRARKQQRAEEAIRRQAIAEQLEAVGAPLYITKRGGGVRGGAKEKRLNTRALTIDQLSAAQEAAASQIANMASSSSATPVTAAPDASLDDEQYQRALADARRMQDELTEQSLMSEEGYREFQQRMARDEKVENLVKFGFSFGLFALFWIIGATVFSRTEGWSWFIGLYFCFITFSTIGYGDFSPASPLGRAFFIIWAIFGIATVTLLIAVLTEAYSNRYKTALNKKGTTRALKAIKHHREQILARQKRKDTVEVAREKAKQLPYEILDTMKLWHQFVVSSRHGHVDTAESGGMRELIEKLMDEQELSEREKRELVADPESRRLLFWNGYERAVHNLVAMAESAVYAQEHEGEGEQDNEETLVARLSYRPRRRATTLSSMREGWDSQPDLGEKLDLPVEMDRRESR